MTADPRQLERARKLLGLWRGAVGGEKDKARGALMRVLETAGLYLSDLEVGLPRVRDPQAAPDANEAAFHLAQLADPATRDEALLYLADAEGLDTAQRQQVLRYLDIVRLAGGRAEGWALSQPDQEITPEAITKAAQALSEDEVARAEAPTLAASIHDLALLHAAALVRPERQLRAESEVQAAFLMSLCAALSSVPARSEYRPSEAGEGQFYVTAYLSANELSQVRARQAREQDNLRRELLQAARQFGARLGRERL